MKVVAEESYDSFKELIGIIVIEMEEPAQHRITSVADILGVRPMFLREHNDRVFFGSTAVLFIRWGLSDGVIDYDAVSA